MKNRIFRRSINLIFAGAVVSALIFSNGCGKKTESAEADTAVQSQAVDNAVEWNGKKYIYNDNLINILFLGVDKSEPMDDTYAPGEAGQSDCVMLLSLDTETKEGRILQINRNTMTQIDIYDKSGNYMDSMEGQLALQYAYDIGGSSSCWAVKKTVEELLYGLSIDGYFALDMEGIPQINDALGGVDVLMKQDYTMIDPSFTEGNTVHLEGEMARRFVRYRDMEEFNSVQNRMERQVDYITAMIDSMKNAGGQKLYDVLSPYLDTYIMTNMDAEQLNALTGFTYLTEEVEYLPGEMKQGEVYEEYYVDDELLQDLLFQMFYTEIK